MSKDQEIERLHKIIEGLQGTISKLEADSVKITFPVIEKEYVPCPVYPQPYQWPHPFGCACVQCNPWSFTWGTGTPSTGVATDRLTITAADCNL